MEITVLIIGIIIYLIVGFILFNNVDSILVKILFAPAELFFFCVGGLGMFFGWLAKKIRLAVDSEYADKTRKESKLKELENDLLDSYSSIISVIKRETEEEEKRTWAEREKREREAYIKQKAADIVSQIKSCDEIIAYISICGNNVVWSNTRYPDDPWRYEGNLSLKFPIKEVTLNKDNHAQVHIISAFSDAYKHNYEQYLLAQEINEYFNNTFTITDCYSYSLCSNDSFTYRCNRIDVSLTK